jgi:hypothetical protein
VELADKFVPNVPLKDGEIKEDLTAIMGDLADRAKAFYNAKGTYHHFILSGWGGFS